jgi:hypothetical protein
MEIDLTKLSTPQLLAIRKILVGGVPAEASKYADADGSKKLKKLEAENKELKREKRWKEIVESYDLEFDDPAYWLDFATEDHLRWVCNRISTAKAEAEREAALAEATRSMKIPPIIGDQRSAFEILRDGFKERRNGDN